MSRPRLATEASLVPGLIAVGLFVLLSAIFLAAPLAGPATFDGGAVMQSLGAALMSIDAGAVVGDGTPIPAEGFVVSLIIVAVALDAALDGSLMLARRDEPSEDESVDVDTTNDAVATDGGAE
jgi:NADH-quinone oxidoreductase subunit J